jgi:hypothetical protein
VVEVLAAGIDTCQNVSSDSDEVTIVYDNLACKPGTSRSSVDKCEEIQSLDTAAPSTSAASHQQEVLLEGCETESNASTSLESTCSNKGIINDVYTECFICACSLDDSRKPVATLPFCMHPFHQTCLDGVLKWHPRCPVCDFHIFSPI